MKKAVLLTNLGSPSAPTPPALKKYLTQFLMDPCVIDISYLLRFFLVRGLIIPKRSKESAEAYSKIWTERGSPLVSFTEDLTKKVAGILGDDYRVDFAMRYGEPSFESALSRFQNAGYSKIQVMPLYPQYALASTVSTIQELERVKRKLNYSVEIDILEAFYKDLAYLNASAAIYKEFLDTQEPFDHYLFSYHGLPERHVKKFDDSKKHCLIREDCCLESHPNNKFCYKHHCTQNTFGIAQRLNLSPDQYSISFQSRLGRDPWLKPYTDIELVQLAKKGVKRLAVFSPAFVADCLETVEEIGMRGKKEFIDAGGQALELVPSLNSHDLWAQCVASWAC